jgi:hypothetical protein
MSVIDATPFILKFDGDAKFHSHDRQGRKKTKITQTLDGEGLWGPCIKKAVKIFETLLVSSS